MLADQLVALNKNRIDAGVGAVEIAMQAWEQWIDLNIEASRALTRETVAQTRTLIAADDVSEALKAWGSDLAQKSWDRSYGYSSNAYEIFVRANLSIAEVLEQNLLDCSQEWMKVIEQAANGSPIGHSESTVSAVRSAMLNATTVIEGISRAARQAAEHADTTVKAAAAATAGAVNDSAGKKVQ